MVSKKRHRERKLERARKAALDSETGFIVNTHAPHLEKAVREEYQRQNGESPDGGPGKVFSEPGELRRDLGLVNRVVAARISLGCTHEKTPNRLIRQAYALALKSPELMDKLKTLETMGKLSKQELEYLKFLGHDPYLREVPNANAPRRPEDEDPNVIDGEAAPAEEPLQIAFQEGATDEQLEQTFDVMERYGIIELLQPGSDAAESEAD